jgi:hypothetical protein
MRAGLSRLAAVFSDQLASVPDFADLFRGFMNIVGHLLVILAPKVENLARAEAVDSETSFNTFIGYATLPLSRAPCLD